VIVLVKQLVLAEKVVHFVCVDVALRRDIVVDYRRKKISHSTMVKRIAELYREV